MVNSESSFSKPRLTKVETYQAERRMVSQDSEKSYIDFFRKNSETRKTVIDAPFTDAVRKKTGEVFGLESAYAVLRAAILAEPDGIYEESFGKLSKGERLQKLYEQIDSSAEITIGLQKYVENNLVEANEASDEELYEALCRTAFETGEEADIRIRFALSQRRGFRLSIANFLEIRQKLSAYRSEASFDPKKFAEKYLKQHFSGNISIEQLPIGFIVYLDEQDYALIAAYDKSPKSISSTGVTLSSSWLPEDLQEKIILINRGGKEGGIKTQKDLSATRDHEIRHLLFREFHAQQPENYLAETSEAVSMCQTEQDYLDLSRAISEDFTERAKDEVIAYFSRGKFDETYYQALRIEHYQWQLDLVREALWKRADFSVEAEKSIETKLDEDEVDFFETVRRIRFVAERLSEEADRGEMNRDKAEALLRNTPGTRIHRLAGHIGLTAEEVKNDKIIKEKIQKVLKGLNGLLNIPKLYDDGWWERASQASGEIERLLPPEAWPVLLAAVSEWSRRKWSYCWVEEAVFLIKQSFLVHGVTESEKMEAKKTMEALIVKKQGDRDYEESVRLAQEILGRLE